MIPTKDELLKYLREMKQHRAVRLTLINRKNGDQEKFGFVLYKIGYSDFATSIRDCSHSGVKMYCYDMLSLMISEDYMHINDFEVLTE